MLDLDTTKQLSQYLNLLENDIVIKLSVGNDKNSIDMEKFINEVSSLTSKIIVKKVQLDRTPSFSINTVNEEFGIKFAGIPLGHEFSSFILALLQVSGRPPKIDQSIIDQIKGIKDKLDFVTYVSLTCQNCPDVVQTLNLMSAINPNINHTMIDGAINTDEVNNKNIMSVPTIYLNDQFFNSGRISAEEILEKIGIETTSNLTDEVFDVLVIGGGPAGASASIYAARKGIKTGIIAERIGGQVLDTSTIENLISVTQTTGTKLAHDLEAHIKANGVNIIKGHRAKKITKKELFEVKLENGIRFKSKTLIIATGATWRNINVPGEQEYKNKGVAYCPHCDGPLFKEKPIAVIGGGNSGIEAAIDLAGTSSHVTVLEFMPTLKADKILQDRLYSLPNINVYTNVAVNEITGTNKVNGLTYTDRKTGIVNKLNLDGVFIQIGLAPNSNWLEDFVERNKTGEIIVDNKAATNIPGVYAAGDCTNSPYKQIIVSMGTGAVAALSAFDYLIRN